MPVPPENYGMGTDAAQMISGGVFAAGAREYLRPASGWQKRVLAAGLCLGGSLMFGDDVAAWLSLSLQVASALAGLVCIGLAEGVLKAADKVDVASMWKGKA